MNEILQLAIIAFLVVYLIGKVMGPIVTLKQQHESSKTSKALMDCIFDPQQYPVSTTACRDIVALKRDSGGVQWTETLQESLLHVVVARSSVDQVHVSFTDSKVPIRGQWTICLHPRSYGSVMTLDAVYTVTSMSWHTPIWTIMLKLTSSKSVWEYLKSVTAD